MERDLERLDTTGLQQIIWDIFIYGHYFKGIDDQLNLEELPKLFRLSKVPNYVFCISIDNYSNMSIQERLQAKELIEHTIDKLMDKKEYLLIFAHQNCFYLNGNVSEVMSQKKTRYYLQELAERIKSALKEFDISITVGIDFYDSQPLSVENWRTIAQHAIVAQRRKFFEGKGRIYFYEPSNLISRSYTNIFTSSYYKMQQDLFYSIIAGDLRSSKKIASLLIESIFRNKLDSLFYLRIKLIEVGSLTVCNMVELKFPESSLSAGLVDFIEKINSFYDVIDLAESFYQLVEYLVSLSIKRGCQFNSLVLKAKEMIDSSDDLSDITLKKVSKQVNVSYSYLSRLFKRELGVSFTEYINTKRLRRAFPLLFDKQRSIDNVAICSGFKSVQQFERIFKRIYDVSPSTYRKTNIRQ